MTKIVLIGFNRCGTRSFHTMFRQNKIRSAHHLAGKLGATVMQNLKTGQPTFHKVDAYSAYSDFSYFSGNAFYDVNMKFRHITKEHPDYYFILNTRNKDDWINSRLKVVEGGGKLQKSNQTREEYLEMTSRRWDVHHRRVRKHFSQAPDLRFLEFNIDRAPIEKLKAFLSGSYTIEHERFPLRPKKPGIAAA